jgi:pimeloyl-ACP methyl ester carboxylesterase
MFKSVNRCPPGAGIECGLFMPLRKPTGTMLSADGVELFVQQRGKGRPLLLINGLGGSSELLEAVEERLSGVTRTIAVELPGAGRSPTPRRPLSISALARVLGTLLDDLGHAKVDVLGFSLGGTVAQQLAHDQPERIRRLGLAATACGWGSLPGTLDALALVSMPFRYYSRTVYEQTTRLLGPADRELLARRPELSEARLQNPPPLLGYLYQFTAGALWSSLPWLADVRVPTLVLNGEADRLVPSANGLQLARLLPKSRLHVLPGEGHLFLCDPESLALPLLEDFFTARTLSSSQAWISGTSVGDDETVEAAFEAEGGAHPHRALSDVYRWFVGHAA